MKTLLTSCPRDVFRDAIAYSILAKRGAKKVTPHRQQLSGHIRDGDHSNARVLEYALPDGTILARLVEACGHCETWLERSVATDVLIARADAEAEKYRVIDQVKAWSLKQDTMNAEKRGMSLEDYRKLRNAQGHRSVMRSGVNSIGMG